MANFERGAQSDDVRVFDGGEDDEDVEGSRLPLLIVIALLVLAAFGAVVWLAYQRGVAQGHSEVPRVIAAEQGPAKVAPGNAGGTPTPYTGLKIYQQPAPSNEDAGNDAATPSKPAAATPAPSKPDTIPTKPVAMTTPPPATTSAPPAMKPAITPAPATKPAPPATKPVASVTPPPAPTKPSPATTPAATPAPAPASTAPAGSGLLQIGAYRSEAEANAAWTTYKAKHAGLLGGASTDVKQVDLGAKGTWYRLRIVTATKSDATALCAKLKAEGGDCILAK
jgi:hypothetical protein